MSLPVGISTATLTYGLGLDFAGGVASATVTVKPTHDAVWTATAQRLLSFSFAATTSGGGAGTVLLPHVDQAGFADGSGNAFTGWSYSVSVLYTSAGGASSLVTKTVQPIVGQTAIDFDALPDGTASASQSTPPAAVTRVEGRTGAVSLDDIFVSGASAQTFTPSQQIQVRENAGVTSLVAAVEDLGGVVGDGSTDDTAALIAAMAAAPANARLVAHSGHTIKISSAVTLPKSLHLDGLNIVQVATGAKGLVLAAAASGSLLRRVKVTGQQFATFTSNERGISVEGTSGAPVTDLTIDTPIVRSFGQYGVYANYAQRLTVLNVDVANVTYIGLCFCSSTEVLARGGIIRNITQGAAPNSYGATASQEVPGTDPPCADVTFDGITVDGVAHWNGFDTHTGQRIKFLNLRALNCKNGIWAVGDNSNINSPLAVEIIGCTVDSGVDDGSADSGILVKGASTGLPWSGGSLAIGAKVVGNTVRRHGLDASGSLSAGYSFYYTQGLLVEGNVADECANAGFMLYHDNYGFTVQGNVAHDPWLNAVDIACGYRISSDYNTGMLGPNTTKRGTKSVTYPTHYGSFIFGGANNDIRHLPGYTDPAIPTPFNDNTGRAYVGFGAQVRTSGRVLAAREATTSTTLTLADDTLFCNGAAVTVTLPAVSATPVGARFTVKNVNSASATLAAGSGDAVEALAGTSTGASVALAQGVALTVQLHPTSGAWRIV